MICIGVMIRVEPQATDDQARDCLAQLATERREDYAGLSRLIGRPAGYLRVPPQRLGASLEQ